MNNAPQFYPKDRQAWRKWLAEHHDTEQAVWLVFDKGKHRTLAWDDIVQEELCFGWIDSKQVSISDQQSKIYISKRKPGGTWSKINKGHAARMIAAGLMAPAGQRTIDEAKKSGAWDALNKVDALELPEMLQELLHTDIVARSNFMAFSDSAKRAILRWIYSAKRKETRDQRIKQTVKLAHQNIKAR